METGGRMKAGRKRNLVPREKNGRARREKGIDPNAIAQLMPHRRLVPANVAHDPKAECILGRLCLNGWINEAQYQAGVKYREIVGRYRAVIDAPRGEVSMSGVIVGPWGGGGILTDDEAKRRRDDYNGSFEAMMEFAGYRQARDVAHVIHDRPQFTLRMVKSGLDALAAHYGLTRRIKYVRS